MKDKRLVCVKDLVAGYHRPVVGPMSLCVEAAEIVGLEGPNGSGKSTILSALTGEARVFSGGIERCPGLTIAHQHQRFARLTEMPLLGRELVRLIGGALEGAPSFVQPTLNERLDRLSGGQLQFLQVWSCLSGPASLVLLDEPTNNMDPSATKALVEVLRNIDPWRGVLVVSHEDEFLRGICHRVINVCPPSL